jgi:hypothetical protein
LAQKLELVYTPKHGSWLNVAEPELSVLSRQCLDRSISTRKGIGEQARNWTRRRNRRQTGVDSHFTTTDARTKLKRLYPKILE